MQCMAAAGSQVRTISSVTDQMVWILTTYTVTYVRELFTFLINNLSNLRIDKGYWCVIRHTCTTLGIKMSVLLHKMS